MSGLDASSRLRRALASHASRAGVEVAIVGTSSTGWASATFVGARHELHLAAVADDAVERWLADLPEAELSVPGHLVADLRIIAMRQAADALDVTLEVLTVEDS